VRELAGNAEIRLKAFRQVMPRQDCSAARQNCLFNIQTAYLLGQFQAFFLTPLLNHWIFCAFFRQKPA
jgi:hypothetical protein